MTQDDTLQQTLQSALATLGAVSGLTRLSGGASQETWRLTLTTAEMQSQTMILRRTPGGRPRPVSETAVTLDVEAQVLKACHQAGIPCPRVVWTAGPDSEAGSAYLMDYVPGETIPRKILRDPEFAEARKVLAHQCGVVLARIHAMPLSTLPALNRMDAAGQLRQYRDIYDSYDYPHPVFELAFKWLEARLPESTDPCLVHGDFRNGNLMVGPEGLRAVLDWELVHMGNPAEDLGWICVNSWRFGQSQNTVGGFGSLESLLKGYAEAGGRAISPEEVRFWIAFGSLKWGIMCMTMYKAFETGADASVERAAIGRRASETEVDLLNIIYGTALT